MSCVPSSAATAASKRPPSRSLLEGLDSDGPWHAAVEVFRGRNPRRRDRIAEYEALLDAGTHRRVAADVLAGCYQPAPPVEGWLNKADGRKKRIFRYPPRDELLFRVVNRLVQPAAGEAASPWCRSFLPGGGARTAFRSVLADPAAGTKAALRLDVRDYFNSIDVVDLLANLPPDFSDGALGALLAAALLDPRVEQAGIIVAGGRKGIMAGTPIAPLLATLYLRDLDHQIARSGATYARYSDDFIALAPAADLPDLERLIRCYLAARGLEVNEDKSAVTPPGQPWDFLGFRYQRGTIGLSPMTERKLKSRTTRFARSLLRWRERNNADPPRAVRAFWRRTNLRLFGLPAERAEFSWATWFLPMISGPEGLRALDQHLQREARFVATGRRSGRARHELPYSSLVDAGHLPLVAAFWAMRRDAMGYDLLVSRRTGLTRGFSLTGGSASPGAQALPGASGRGQLAGDGTGERSSRVAWETPDLQHD